MRCPICRQETLAKGNPFRPFCGERCKLIDLDNWLAGRYRISTPVETVENTTGSGETARETQESAE
jgi:uncharacterized protein